jgi:hypothetical protein
MQVAVVTLSPPSATDNSSTTMATAVYLVLTVPVGGRVTIQCLTIGTVPHSWVVTDGKATDPVNAEWSTPDPRHGLDPGQSAGFAFTMTAPGSYRIASLVDGSEASGMWADLEVTAGGVPTLTAP